MAINPLLTSAAFKLTDYAKSQGLDPKLIEAVLQDKGILVGPLATGVTTGTNTGTSSAPTAAPTAAAASSPAMERLTKVLDAKYPQPGNLITAEFMGAIVEAIVDLDKRLVEVIAKLGQKATESAAPSVSNPSTKPTVVGGATIVKPKVTSAVFQRAAEGLGAVSITGTNLSKVNRIEINGKEIDSDKLTIRDNAIEFVLPQGEEDLRGAEINVFSDSGQDARVMAPATGKRLQTLNALIRDAR